MPDTDPRLDMLALLTAAVGGDDVELQEAIATMPVRNVLQVLFLMSKFVAEIMDDEKEAVLARIREAAAYWVGGIDDDDVTPDAL